jgi:hypothetical protein
VGASAGCGAGALGSGDDPPKRKSNGPASTAPGASVAQASAAAVAIRTGVLRAIENVFLLRTGTLSRALWRNHDASAARGVP